MCCVFGEPGKVVSSISAAEHWSWLSGAKINEKSPICLVLSRVPFKSGVLIHPLSDKKIQIKNIMCLVCSTDCPGFEVKARINVLIPSDVINR